MVHIKTALQKKVKIVNNIDCKTYNNVNFSIGDNSNKIEDKLTDEVSNQDINYKDLEYKYILIKNET